MYRTTQAPGGQSTCVMNARTQVAMDCSNFLTRSSPFYVAPLTRTQGRPQHTCILCSSTSSPNAAAAPRSHCCNKSRSIYSHAPNNWCMLHDLTTHLLAHVIITRDWASSSSITQQGEARAGRSRRRHALPVTHNHAAAYTDTGPTVEIVVVARTWPHQNPDL